MTKLLDRKQHAALGMPVALASPAVGGQVHRASLARVRGIPGNRANLVFVIAP